MPNNISKIESYSPNLTPTIETEALRWINKRVGVSAGLRSENKGMKSTASVREYSMKLGGELDGKFDGIVDTKMTFNYLGLPILAHYVFTESFSLYAGAYYAYLLNGEFKGTARDGTLDNGTNTPSVDSEPYDYSRDLRHYDAGFSIGLNFLPYNEHILLSFDFNYGLVSVFQDNFDYISDDMQNVYGKFSVGYVF
jgi:hypothetical protein